MLGPGTIDKIDEHELAGVVSVYKSLGFGSRPSGILKYSTYEYYDDPPNLLVRPRREWKEAISLYNNEVYCRIHLSDDLGLCPDTTLFNTREDLLEHLKESHPNEYNNITQGKSFGKHSWVPEIIDLKKCVAAIEEHSKSLPKVVAAKNLNVNYDSGVDWDNAAELEKENINQDTSKSPAPEKSVAKSPRNEVAVSSSKGYDDSVEGSGGSGKVSDASSMRLGSDVSMNTGPKRQLVTPELLLHRMKGEAENGAKEIDANVDSVSSLSSVSTSQTSKATPDVYNKVLNVSDDSSMEPHFGVHTNPAHKRKHSVEKVAELSGDDDAQNASSLSSSSTSKKSKIADASSQPAAPPCTDRSDQVSTRGKPMKLDHRVWTANQLKATRLSLEKERAKTKGYMNIISDLKKQIEAKDKAFSAKTAEFSKHVRDTQAQGIIDRQEKRQLESHARYLQGVANSRNPPLNPIDKKELDTREEEFKRLRLKNMARLRNSLQTLQPLFELFEPYLQANNAAGLKYNQAVAHLAALEGFETTEELMKAAKDDVKTTMKAFGESRQKWLEVRKPFVTAAWNLKSAVITIQDLERDEARLDMKLRGLGLAAGVNFQSKQERDDQAAEVNSANKLVVKCMNLYNSGCCMMRNE